MAGASIMSSLALKPAPFLERTQVKGVPSLVRPSSSFQGKGVYQFVDKYGANVDGYSPIYNENEWSPTGDVYVGETTGPAIWDVTLAGILAGGALLVYNNSALAQ